MRIMPAINCSEWECVRSKVDIASKMLSGMFRRVHMDVSDGIFTSVKTWNDPHTLKQYIDSNGAIMDITVHLMVKDAEKEIILWAGSGIIKRAILPLATGMDPRKFVEICSEYGVIPELSVAAGESVEGLSEYADIVQDFMILTVSPGLSGQPFGEDAAEKIMTLRKRLPGATIEVDGGINLETAKLAKSAGADIAASSSYLFDDKDPLEAYRRLSKEAA